MSHGAGSWPWPFRLVVPWADRFRGAAPVTSHRTRRK